MKDKLEQLRGHAEKLQDHVDAVEAFTKSDEVKDGLAAVDRGVGKFLGPALAAIWVFAALITTLAAYLFFRFLDGQVETVLLVITGLAGFYSLWRIFRAVSDPPKVSEIVVDEIEERTKPVKSALGIFKFLYRFVPTKKKQ